MSSGGGDEPPRRSITQLFSRKKAGSRSTTTPTTTPTPVTPPTVTLPTPTTTSYLQPEASPHTIGGAASHLTRRYIEPEGNTFNPHGPPTHEITNIIRSNFFAAYLSWKQIPREVRDMWFHEFERSFEWLPQHHHHIRINFEKAGSKRLRDMFTDIRASGEKPHWIGEGIWAELNRAWGSATYAKKCAQNKINRASDCGGVGTSLSTGGSVPFTEHRRRLEKELGREPTMSELHIRTHQKQKTKEWIDERARIVNEEYLRLLEQQSQSSADASSAASSEVQSDFSLWSQAVGGKKKGRIYGLGSQGPVFDTHGSSYTAPSDYSGLNVMGRMQNLETTMQHQQQQIADQQKQMADQQQRMEEQQQQMVEQQQQMVEQQLKHQMDMQAQQLQHQREMSKLLKHIQRKFQSSQQDEDDDDDDDDYL